MTKLADSARAADVAGEVAGLDAVFKHALAPAEGPAGNLRLAALEVEAIFHLDRQGAAQGVRAEDRAAGDEAEAVDGEFRHEIPIHRSAEHLVDAHAVLINGEALRLADLRRGVETAEQQVRLKGTILRPADIDAGSALLERGAGSRQNRRSAAP